MLEYFTCTLYIELVQLRSYVPLMYTNMYIKDLTSRRLNHIRIVDIKLVCYEKKDNLNF